MTPPWHLLWTVNSINKRTLMYITTFCQLYFQPGRRSQGTVDVRRCKETTYTELQRPSPGADKQLLIILTSAVRNAESDAWASLGSPSITTHFSAARPPDSSTS